MDVDPLRIGIERSVATAPPAAGEFRALYDSYFDCVWRYVRRLGVPEALVDDAVQEVFVVVYRRLDSFQGRSTMRTWILGIALRVARDHRRREGRRSHTETLAEDTVDPRPGPLDTATTAEALRQVLAALERLDDPKREVFVLVELEQLTVPEVSDVLGVSINTLYARLRAARLAFESAMHAIDRSVR